MTTSPSAVKPTAFGAMLRDAFKRDMFFVIVKKEEEEKETKAFFFFFFLLKNTLLCLK
jgi:hypothetical protein